MQSVRLANSELVCSRMGYGCWRIAGWEGSECTPERELHGHQAVVAAFENGFTLFDHDDIYSDGMGEVIFGKVLKEIPEFRGRAIIASKCGIRRAGKPDAHAPYRYDFSYEHIVSSCEASLKRLGAESFFHGGAFFRRRLCFGGPRPTEHRYDVCHWHDEKLVVLFKIDGNRVFRMEQNLVVLAERNVDVLFHLS